MHVHLGCLCVCVCLLLSGLIQICKCRNLKEFWLSIGMDMNTLSLSCFSFMAQQLIPCNTLEWQPLFLGKGKWGREMAPSPWEGSHNAPTCQWIKRGKREVARFGSHISSFDLFPQYLACQSILCKSQNLPLICKDSTLQMGFSAR